MSRFAVCLDTVPKCPWVLGVQVQGEQALLIPSGSLGTAPGAGRVGLAMLLGDWGCGKHRNQGKSLRKNPKPPPTKELVHLRMEFCKWSGCVSTGYAGSFPEQSAPGTPHCSPGSPVSPANPSQSRCSLAGKLLAALRYQHRAAVLLPLLLLLLQKLFPRRFQAGNLFKYLDLCSF